MFNTEWMSLLCFYPLLCQPDLMWVHAELISVYLGVQGSFSHSVMTTSRCMGCTCLDSKARFVWPKGLARARGRAMAHSPLHILLSWRLVSSTTDSVVTGNLKDSNWNRLDRDIKR